MAANGSEEAERKRDVLLSVTGPKEYRLLGSLLAPAKPGEKSYDELVEVLSVHHNPAPSEIVQRYRFHTRMKEPGETVSKYVSELRSLAKACNFGTSLEDMIRNRLVCGVNDDAIQAWIAKGHRDRHRSGNGDEEFPRAANWEVAIKSQGH